MQEENKDAETRRLEEAAAPAVTATVNGGQQRVAPAATRGRPPGGAVVGAAAEAKQDGERSEGRGSCRSWCRGSRA